MPFLKRIMSGDERTRPAANAAGLRIELWKDALAYQALEKWGELEQRLTDVPLASSRVWTETWLKYYGDFVPHRFALGFVGDQLKAICLLTEGVDRRTGPFPITTLHLGTNGEPEQDRVCVEYNNVAGEDKFRKGFLKQLLQVIEKEPRWDAFCLEAISSNTYDELSLGHEAETIRTTPAHYFDLKTARDEQKDAIAYLGQSTRKRIRRNLRSYGELSREWAETSIQADSIYEDLVRLHQERWEAVGEPGAYASERFREFHRELIQKLLPSGEVVLFRVRHGERVIGCLHHYVDRNRLLGYQNGFLMEDTKLSPGVVVDYLCLEEAGQRGYDAYDFLSGDTEHKRKLSTDSSTMLWALQRRTRMRFAVVDYSRRMKGWFKQYSESNKSSTVVAEQASLVGR